MGFLKTMAAIKAAEIGVELVSNHYSHKYEKDLKKQQRQQQREQEKAEDFFSEISQEKFGAIVHMTQKKFKEINDLTVEGTKVIGSAYAPGNTCAWYFYIDFDDDGYLTGRYRLQSEKPDHPLPAQLAKQIQQYIKTISDDPDNALNEEISAQEVLTMEETPHGSGVYCPFCSRELTDIEEAFCQGCRRRLHF